MLVFWCSNNTIYSESNYLGWWRAEYMMAFWIPFSSGFGVETSEDNMVAVDNGTKRHLICGTEKGKHRCKNFRTAGIFVNKGKTT